MSISDSDSVNLGSNPGPPATEKPIDTMVLALMSATDNSENADKQRTSGRTEPGTGRHPGQATLDRLNAAGSGAVARDLTQDEDQLMRRALTASSTPPEPSCCALCGFLQNENAKLRAALLALVRQ